MTLAALPLQDAVLADVRFDWQAARCTCSFLPVDLAQHVLVFSGVTELHVPCRQPWGPSGAILGVHEVQTGTFEIELQSGDVLRIAAASWEFRRERRTATR